MTLNEAVRAKVAEWQLPGAGRQTLLIPDESCGWAVKITADRNDEVGCLLWEVEARRGADAGPGCVEALRGWAAQSAERVTGLLETLKVVEVDVQRREALLRSDEPVQRNGALCYYEVLLKDNHEAVLRRYRAWHGDKRREQVLFPLTHEALAKVVAGLIAEQ